MNCVSYKSVEVCLSQLEALTVSSSPPVSPALKIHLSSATKEVLDEFGYFDLQLRGDVEMKVRRHV
ncbi:Atrial natriuretic peptide receptor 2 [Liparis tanakae]|uniref:Atrial natriuretic peptide receptor 2 n=1 Tax=Liparis tanakae TaxID=230148 RepID=A0A4Z2E0T8_9TELE|nr:Atrial natriuretic peptide receptor 2 [Liparis tanakae]